MLTIRIGGTESFDETKSEFVETGGILLDLEHSLLSLSKWESIYERPFLGKPPEAEEEMLAYIKCMCMTPNFPPEHFQELSQKNIEDINAYIEAKRSATWFSEKSGPPRSREVITSELIYYWMTVFKIPFTCETWHLNRLFMLIRVCDLKQAKPKKMTRAEIAKRNRDLNAQRKAQLGTTG